MQTNDLPRIGVLSADPAAVTQFLRRVQALGADPTALLPLSPAAVPDCEPYLCGTSTQSPLPKLRAAAEVLAASGCTVIAVPDSAGVFCEEITAAVGIPTLGVSGPALQQLVGKLRQRASVLCTPGVRRQCLRSRRAALWAALQLSRRVRAGAARLRAAREGVQRAGAALDH